MRHVTLRRILQAISVLLFPLLINWFSPYLVVVGAWSGFITGSALVFISMLLFSPWLGRLWCGWLCPAGAIMDGCMTMQRRPITRRGISQIKWFIWTPWLVAILAGYAAHPLSLHFWPTFPGESLSHFHYLVVILKFIIIALLFALPALFWGRRAGCHAYCWMAPFLILGTKLGKQMGIAQLSPHRLSEECISCDACANVCPMSLDVSELIKTGSMEHPECVSCARCVEACKIGVLTFKR